MNTDHKQVVVAVRLRHRDPVRRPLDDDGQHLDIGRGPAEGQVERLTQFGPRLA